MKIFLLLTLLLPIKLLSQTIINDYNAVTALAGNIATVTSLTGTQGIHTLAPGDTVLIIQMQGATMDITNTSVFGNLISGNNAGKNEINVICAVSGNRVAFKFALVNTYTPGVGSVQIVSHGNGQLVTYTIPAAGITGQAWDGTTGGVIFIKANNIILGGNVIASGLGFRGGKAGGIPGNPGNVCNKNVVTNPGLSFLWNNSGCNGASSTVGATDYFYPKYNLDIPVAPAFLHYSPTDPASPPANLLLQYTGGWKGEGIVAYMTDMETGRGKQANGGGGGQTHNSGGAGGAMYGTGGNGGNQWNGASPSPFANGGTGGETLTPVGFFFSSTPRLFMGGGGGGGHANYPNGNASDGANGGGIILFRGMAMTSIGGFFNISSNGNSNVPKLDNDSEGGGGAGGSIYFDINTITFGATGVNLMVTGGNGGNATNGGDCIGPGGGGGGGYVLSRSTIPPTVNKFLTGGTNGITTGVTSGPCLGAAPINAWGAMPGNVGLLTDGLASYKTALGTTLVSCVLPVHMVSFNASSLTDKVVLLWSTAMEQNNDYFLVERSKNGVDFYDISTIKGAGNSMQLLNYTFVDQEPGNGINYYRIKQVDFNNNFTYSEVRNTNIKTGYGILSIYPEPVNKSEKLNIKYIASQNSKAFIQVMDVLGREIYSGSYNLLEGINLLNLNLELCEPGICFLLISSYDGTQSRKIVIE